MKKTFKEIMIALLVLVIIGVTTWIALYNMLSNQKTIPTLEKYVRSEEIQKVISTNIKNEDAGVSVRTFSLGDVDINAVSSKTNLKPGRSNPFATLGKEEETSRFGAETSSSNAGGTQNPRPTPSDNTPGRVFNTRTNGK